MMRIRRKAAELIIGGSGALVAIACSSDSGTTGSPSGGGAGTASGASASSGLRPALDGGGATGGKISGSAGMSGSAPSSGAGTSGSTSGGTQPGVIPDSGTSEGGGSDASGSLPPVVGDELFVATTGDDANTGTRQLPFKSLAAAQAAVRAHPDKGKVPITVTVLPGEYFVGKTVVFTPNDSGTATAPITYRGGGAAIISGGAPLHVQWSAYQNGIMQATVPAGTSGGLAFDSLFLNKERQRMARYPNYRAGVVPFGGASASAVASTRVAGWKHSPVGGFVHGMQANNWGSEHYVIKGVDASHNLTLDGPYGNGRPAGLMSGSQVVENIFDELDAPGEWYFDSASGTLYVMPPSGVDLNSADIEVSATERIFEFQGTATAPVQWITLDGFHYIDTARTFAKATEIILRSDWMIYRGGAVFVTGAEDCTISGSFFDQVGGAGVFVNGYDRRVHVASDKFIATGSSAILFMGSRSAVRNPLTGYDASSIPVNQLDMTPGPLGPDYPAQCDATGNLIHDIGDPEKQVAGVGIDMAQDITVTHNSIYSMPRAGINIGDGCWGGHSVTYNDVFDTVLETGDHGSYNSWGRDRYWVSSTSGIESRVAQVPGLPLLDVVKPITLANNRWRCDHGWDVDLDDGSSNYVITNNLFLAGGLKWREGYSRVGDNNVFAGAGMSVHVWPKNNQDVFTHNILPQYAPVNPDGWGKELDYNFFTSASGLSGARGYGVDAHSISGTPGFNAPASGNFQLAANSPASGVGIKSLSADSYGVVNLALRAQAKTPYFGLTSGADAGARDSTPETWRGAQVANLIGLDEQSATGISGDVGVIVNAVPSGAQAAGDGLQVLDVILALNGSSVASLDDLNRLYAMASAGQKVTLGVHRNQMDTMVTFTR